MMIKGWGDNQALPVSTIEGLQHDEKGGFSEPLGCPAHISARLAPPRASLFPLLPPKLALLTAGPIQPQTVGKRSALAEWGSSLPRKRRVARLKGW